MKRFFQVILILLTPVMASAQQKTLFGDNAYLSGYGGPICRVTRIAGEAAAFGGGRGALLVNGTWGLGFSGIGWSDRNVRGNDGGSYEVDAGYGGVTFEYIWRTMELVHVAGELTTAAGGASQNPPASNSTGDDAFLVLEPAVMLEVNVARSFRIAAGGTYRFVNGIDLPAFTNDDFSGASFVVLFKFGRFAPSSRR